MTLGPLLHEALSALPAHDHPLTEAKELRIGEGSQQAVLRYFDKDRYSVTLETLRVSNVQTPISAPRDWLHAHAAELVRRLSFLEEPLAVWELDGVDGMAQLRSSPPQRDGNTVEYWEVTLQAGETVSAQLTRYRWTAGMPEREVVAYPVTFTLTTRLCEALEASLAEG